MKGDTALDYAEFQLTPKRTRCELLVSADGFMEKLASGFVKPFITHLRAAELQVVKGSHVIRLETKSECEKSSHHYQGKYAWFSKGTIERFVRFVSTPEIIERVKTIEDELTQLEQVRIALVNTFAQTSDRFPYGDALTGQQQTRDGTDALVPRSFSTDKEDNEPDASKKELLRAMEARLNALHQEQDIAFSRANAAGFDNNNIADLIAFAQQFGADRLHDACIHFVALLRMKTVPEGGQGGLKSPAFESPSGLSGCTLASAYGPMPVSKKEGFLQSTKRMLDFGASRPQANKFGGEEMKGIDAAKREVGQKGNITRRNLDHIADVRNDETLHARLQQMAQQVDARSKEDFGWPIEEEEKDSTFQGSEDEADGSFENKLSNTSVTERNTSLPALKIGTEGLSKQHPSLFKTVPSKDEISKQKDAARIPEEVSSSEPGKSNGNQGDAPARRLSVQAAISLFESKKQDSNELPFRKLTKQESRKTLSEGLSSPSEKCVLKRWNAQSPLEAQMLESRVPEIQQDLGAIKIKGEVNQAFTAPKLVLDPPLSRSDEQTREDFKKSLSSLLQKDTVQHVEQGNKSKSMDANVQHSKHYNSLVQEPSNVTIGSNVRLDLKSSPSGARNTLVVKLGMEKVEFEAATATMMAGKTRLVKELSTDMKLLSEVEPHKQPSPSQKSIDNKAKPEQGQEDKDMVKIHHTKETLLPKPSQIAPPRSRISSQVLPGAACEPENLGTQKVAILQSEQVSEKITEKVSQKEPTASSDRQTKRNTRSGKPSVPKTVSPVKELPTNVLASSVDLHMQALFQMVEHQYINSSCNDVDLASEQRGEQRGKHYDQYAKLRDAKLRGEHPAKKAEREAKLKSMQETLERRRAEMQTKAARLSKKIVQDARTAELVSEKIPQNVGISGAMVDQKDFKAEDDDTDQEEYSVKAEDPVLDSSNPNSPSTTPRPSKSQYLSLKLQAPTRTLPTLSKSVSNNRNAARGGGSSPKPAPKNLGGTPTQGKPSSLNASAADTTAVKSLLNVRDVARNSTMRTSGSARVHPRLNVSASEATNLIDDPNNVCSPGNAERQESKHQATSTRKSITTSRSLNMDAETSLVCVTDQQEGASDALDNTPQKTVAISEARPFLRKGRGIGPGAGPGIAKEKASIHIESSENPDGDKSTESKEDEVCTDSKTTKSIAENPLGGFAANDEGLVQDQDGCSSGVEMVPTMIEDSGSFCSRPSTGTTNREEVEASDGDPGEASENNKQVPDIIISHENFDKTGPEVNQNQKEGALMMQSDLSQKISDSVVKNANYVASSFSFREASLMPHGHIGSPYPASASHPYSSILQRGAVSSRFSPPREDLPLNSPALWNASQSSKLVQDGELAHSSRRLNGNQRQPTMVPLPPKEPSKGFKRLLHFGRKSRTSENTTDCISVSTTSEGDDDADEGRESGSQLSDELLQRIRIQKRGFESGNMGDQVSYSDQDRSQFFGTAIPAPPANFKLREELLTGGNLLKAPRSFFSLSSFRSSKGGEGKSR